MTKLESYKDMLAHYRATDGKYTAQTFLKAASGTGDVSDIIDTILIIAETHGIPKTDLSELAEKSAVIQAQKRKQERTATLAEVGKRYAELAEKADTMLSADVDKSLADINAEAAKLSSIDAEPKRPKILTAEAYLAECETYDPTRDFKPSMLAGLRFPNGTLSYIGGRPGAGKSALLVNIAREALEVGRNVFLVNLEMLNRAIASNIILSCMYAETTPEERRELNMINEPAATYYGLFRKGYTASKQFVSLRKKAIEKVTPLFGNRLVIYDGTRGTLEEVIADITSRVNEGDVVLIDYAQRLPPPIGAQRDARYLHIKSISNELLKTAINKKAVIISGAQFGRDTAKEATLDSFREGGDIEQDAHNALAIETADDDERYVHVLKAREGGAQFKRQKVDCVFPYLYIDGIEAEYVISDDQPAKKKQSKSGKVNTDKPNYNDPNFVFTRDMLERDSEGNLI